MAISTGCWAAISEGEGEAPAEPEVASDPDENSLFGSGRMMMRAVNESPPPGA